jgi:hypothetical protein
LSVTGCILVQEGPDAKGKDQAKNRFVETVTIVKIDPRKESTVVESNLTHHLSSFILWRVSQYWTCSDTGVPTV